MNFDVNADSRAVMLRLAQAHANKVANDEHDRIVALMKGGSFYHRTWYEGVPR